MRRTQLEELVRELISVSGRDDLILIGSQCVHAITESPPAEVLMSAECDVLLDDADEASRLIDERLGRDSEFERDHGVYADTVSPGFPHLPDGWDRRLVELDLGTARVRCLERNDLALSKLVAGRLKDYELVAALIMTGALDVDAVRERAAETIDPNLRTILLGRLQIVVESIGRR